MEFKQAYKYIFSIEFYLRSESNSGSLMYKEDKIMKNKTTSTTEVKRSKAGETK